MAELGGYLLDGLFNGISDGIYKIKDAAEKIWTTIKSPFERAADWFREIFSEAWSSVKSIFSSGGAVFQNIENGIAETFKGIVNSLKE